LRKERSQSTAMNMYPSGEPRLRVPGIVSSRATPPDRAARGKSVQGFQQSFGVHKVRRRETFRVRAVDSRQRLAGLVASALPLPEPRETHRRPQLPRPALLAAGYLDGLAEALLGG